VTQVAQIATSHSWKWQDSLVSSATNDDMGERLRRGGVAADRFD
jgi:hypothetical protein